MRASRGTAGARHHPATVSIAWTETCTFAAGYGRKMRRPPLARGGLRVSSRTLFSEPLLLHQLHYPLRDLFDGVA